MRVLILENNEIDLLAIQRALGGRYEIKSVDTLNDALDLISRPGWSPDVIVANLNVADSQGEATLEALQGASMGTPVIVSAGAVNDSLRQRMDALGADLHDRSHGYTLLRAVLQQHQIVHQTIAANKVEILTQIEQVSQRAAESAVARAIQHLMARLGLDDEEGVRMAVRLARGWETAKSRFFSTLATGVASAVLLAIGAGIIAMIRQGDPR